MPRKEKGAGVLNYFSNAKAHTNNKRNHECLNCKHNGEK